MSVMIDIQKDLKAHKGQWNDFGKYNYRSCEDIIEAVKPLLFDKGLHLKITDEMVNLGDRYYIKATAQVKEGEKVVEESTGYAREALTKKGMDESQITGAASSYARKYALNGLFAIDDAKDADSQDNRDYGAPAQTTPEPDDKPWFNDDDLNSMRPSMIAKIQSGERTPQEIVKNLRTSFKVNKKMASEIEGLV